MKKYILITFIFILSYAGATTMSIFSSDFQKLWNELSKDVTKLNEYTETHQDIQLRNLKVESLNLDNAIFNGGVFEGVTFENVSAKNSKHHKMKFAKCKFINCRYWNAEFVDVEFEDCQFISTGFLGSQVINVKIINCEGTEAEFDDLRGSELVVENSVLNDLSSFTDSKIPLSFRNTTLSGVNMMGLSGYHSLTIESGMLDEVNFGKSHFSDVTLRRVKQGEGGVKFNGVTAESINFENVEMMRGTGIGYATVGTVRIVGGKMYGPSFLDAKIAKVYVRDAYVTRFAIGNMMGQIHVNNSILHRSGLFDGFVDEFNVSNSTIDEIVGENFKADTVIWDNVTLDGKIDLTNAHIKDFRPTRLKRGTRLQLITTRSNIRF
jgi:uncharacterized protein YjbI with pentapeptide repeats